jgi:hypothetical protein
MRSSSSRDGDVPWRRTDARGDTFPFAKKGGHFWCVCANELASPHYHGPMCNRAREGQRARDCHLEFRVLAFFTDFAVSEQRTRGIYSPAASPLERAGHAATNKADQRAARVEPAGPPSLLISLQ